MLGKVVVVAALVTAISLPATAQQQPACAQRGDLLKHLSAKYTEAPVALGLANKGGVVEVLSSKTGSSWTIIITMPNGPTNAYEIPMARPIVKGKMYARHNDGHIRCYDVTAPQSHTKN